MKNYVLVLICLILIGCSIDISATSTSYDKQGRENFIQFNFATPSFDIIEENSENQFFYLTAQRK